MSIKESHKHRVAQIRKFISGNKLFIAMAAAVIMLLLSGSYFFNRVQEGTTEETANDSEMSDLADDTHWRYYPIDSVILLVGGGFCVVMIIRERRKSKEELQ